MSKLTIPSYTVIRDSRDKKGYGWIFEEQPVRPGKSKAPLCLGTKIQKLDIGDYTLEGYEDILSIERKNSFGELWMNFTQSKKKFEQKMDQMSELKYKYIIIECVLTLDHFDLSPPQFKVNVPGRALISWLIDLSMKYGVHIIPTGDSGKKYAQCIFKNVVRNEKDRWNK